MLKFWAGTLPLILITGAIVTTPQIISATSAAATVTTLSPANPIKMERFSYYSAQPTKFIRPVTLQKKVGNSWKDIYWGNTGANGRYRFTVHTGSIDTLRSYSKAFKYKGKTYPAVATSPITVRPVNQSVSFSTTSVTTANVSTTPGRSGRKVTLQRMDGPDKWGNVAAYYTNASGNASLKFPMHLGFTRYRVYVWPYNGAPGIFSSIKTTDTYRWLYLSDMDTVQDNDWNFRDNAKMSGSYYRHSFGNYQTYGNTTYGYYDLSGRKCLYIRATVGVDDRSPGVKAAFEFSLDKDGNNVPLGTVKIYKAKQINQNITGVNRLGLIGYRVRDDNSSDYDAWGRWGDPQVYCAS